MRAAVLVGVNEPLEIWDLEFTDLAPGQVLVKILVSGLCGAQLQEIRGNKGNSKFIPHLLGHEGCGVVETVGPGVTNVKRGDLVVMHWRVGLGIESAFPMYQANEKRISGGKVTTLSEYSVVSENRLTVIPTDTDLEFAALLGCSLSTAMGVIENEVHLRAGQSVLVLGCGGVGLSLIQAAKLHSAFPVVALDSSSEKELLAKGHGASKFTYNLSLLNERFDVIIDTTGSPHLIRDCFQLIAPSGILILVGQTPGSLGIEIQQPNHLFEGSGKTIKASQGGMTKPHLDIPRYIKLFREGILTVNKTVSHRFGLDKLNDAVATLESGKAGRIMIQLE